MYKYKITKRKVGELFGKKIVIDGDSKSASKHNYLNENEIGLISIGFPKNAYYYITGVTPDFKIIVE